MKFGRISRSSSIDDDQKSLMGHQRSSGLDDSTELSSDVEGGNNDYEDLEYENDADQTANEGPEKKRAQR